MRLQTSITYDRSISVLIFVQSDLIYISNIYRDTFVWLLYASSIINDIKHGMKRSRVVGLNDR